MQATEVKVWKYAPRLREQEMYSINHIVRGDKSETDIFIPFFEILYKVQNGKYLERNRYYDNDEEKCMEIYNNFIRDHVNIEQPKIHRMEYVKSFYNDQHKTNQTYKAYENLITNDIFVEKKFMITYFIENPDNPYRTETYKNIYLSKFQELHLDDNKEELIHSINRKDIECKLTNFRSQNNGYQILAFIRDKDVYIQKIYKDKIVISNTDLLPYIYNPHLPVYTSYDIFNEDVKGLLIYDKDAKFELSKEEYNCKWYKYGELSAMAMYKKDHIVITDVLLKDIIPNEENLPIFFMNSCGGYKRL